MRASLPTLFRATRAARADPNLLARANPGQVKVWKTYSYVRNEKTRQLSPFELDVVGPLLRNVGDKIKHKVEDNFFDVAPGFVFFGVMLYAALDLKKSIDLHHRD